jgi:ABC-type branched-subunit amino acid transport system substrate-binding protein
MGTFNAASGASSLSACLPCAPGHYSLVVGASLCSPCPANHACNASSITPCPVGFFSPAISSVCLACSTGCSTCISADVCTNCTNPQVSLFGGFCTSDIITILSIQSLTGVWNASGRAAKHAGRWFQQWINSNKNGVITIGTPRLGYTNFSVNISLVDDGSNPADNAALTTQLLGQYNSQRQNPAPLVALMGPHPSLASSSAQLAESANTFNFQVSLDDKVYQQGLQFIYGPAGSWSMFPQKFLQNLGNFPSINTISIIYNARPGLTSTVCHSAAQSAPLYTLNVTLFAAYPDLSDYNHNEQLSHVIQGVLAAQADILMVCNDIPDGLEIAQQLYVAQTWKHKAVFMTAGPTMPNTWSKIGDAGFWVFAPTVWTPAARFLGVTVPDDQFSETHAFMQSWQNMFHEIPTDEAMACLNSYLALYAALRRSSTWQQVDVALAKLSITTLLGATQFDQNNQNTYLNPLTVQIQPQSAIRTGESSGVHRDGAPVVVYPLTNAQKGSIAQIPSPHYVAWIRRKGCPDGQYEVPPSDQEEVSGPLLLCSSCPPNAILNTTSGGVGCTQGMSATIRTFLLGWGVATLVVVCAVAVTLMVYREHPIVKATAPYIGLVTCAGGGLAAVSVLARAFPGTRFACTTTQIATISYGIFVISLAKSSLPFITL